MPLKFPHPNSGILPHQIYPEALPSSTRSQQQAKVVGSLLGLAVGDALGASVEFRPRQYLLDNPVKDLQSGGTWGLNAGQWTDDTSMALCLASSLIVHQNFNPYDQMVRYKWWYRNGFLSSTGKCFDIGQTTRAALEEFARRQNILKQAFPGIKDEEIDHLSYEQVKQIRNFNVFCGKPGDAGNGPLMRLAPIPLFYFRTPELAVELAGQSALLTHGDQKAADACRYYAALIVAAVNGETKDRLLSSRFYNDHRHWFGHNELHPEVIHIAQGSYQKPRGYDDGIRGQNYIIKALEAALWAFWSDEGSFEKGALKAVNLGDDTDTTAAIYGQLAGACYSVAGIPEKWFKRLYANNLIICVAEWIYYLGGQSFQKPQQQMISSQKSSQFNVPTTTYKTNPQEYHGYGKPEKIDPAKKPAAGVPSGFRQN